MFSGKHHLLMPITWDGYIYILKDLVPVPKIKTCIPFCLLGISQITISLPVSEPRSWSVAHVQKWISYIVHQYKLPMINLDYFQMNGLGLTMINEEDFRTLSPEAGATLFAHLDIWLNGKKNDQLILS
jgi:hypothetical protein